MPRTKGDAKFEDLPEEDRKGLFEAIRDASLDQMANGLRGLGISEDEITKARAECIATNSDKPFVELMKASRTYQRELQKFLR